MRYGTNEECYTESEIGIANPQISNIKGYMRSAIYFTPDNNDVSHQVVLNLQGHIENFSP